ncbi:MAG TPA: aspartate kinase [Bacteroidota bacterium]|jgi:aspartate kinase|nr:aspartate kinase [Bacteroidota bacterium]
MIVMKFGGTSTQDSAAISNVVSIIRARLHKRPFIVISAIAKATNILENAGKLASEGQGDEALRLLRGLIDRHLSIIEGCTNEERRRTLLRDLIESSFCELEALVGGVSILRELTPRTLDAFYCYGEILSSRIVAAALQDGGVDAQWIDTNQFMVTDDNFTRALPLAESVEKRLTAIAEPLLQRGVVPVTQGFIGVTTSGRRTTMGRESSDYSAAVIGAALNADEIQIWTDVDGVLTADPRVVSSPMKVKQLSFEEAYELSFFGAKVLHPNTMLPAIEKNIPIHVYNSRFPGGSGTSVAAKSAPPTPIVKSIAYKRNVVLLNVTPKARFGQYVFWEHVYSILTRHGAVSSLTCTSEYSIAIALDAKNNIEAIVHELSSLGYVSVQEDRAILCLVGSMLKDSRTLLTRFFNVVAGENVDMLSFGASASSISIIIDDERVLDAVKTLHEELFASLPDNELFELLEYAPAF